MIKLKKQIQSKQSGMTAIMLAMFLAIVISLLAVGFATLVRKDQAETLDKTLSYQAQYAAESGVNRITSYIDTTALPLTRSDCNDAVDASIPPKEFTVGQAQVTCAVWEKGVPEMVLRPSIDSPKFGSFTGVQQIKISWDSAAYTGSTDVLPTLDSKPVLGITLAEKDSTYTNLKRYYLLPHNNSGCGNQVYLGGGSAKPSGAVLCSKVDGSGSASVTIEGFDRLKEYYINVNPISGSGNVPVTIQKGGGPGTFVNTSQYKIDVNAKAQDITKRVVVYYNPSGTPGKPYVVNIPSGGTICKDYKVDGNQQNSVSTGGSDECPGI